MPDDPRQAQYRREACQQLLLGDGWRVVLEWIVRRLSELDARVFPPALPSPERDQHIGARGELTQLVKHVYEWAGQPNPFDTHRQGLWSTVERTLPTLPPVDEAPAEAVRQALVAEQRARSRQRAGRGV